MSEFKLCKNGHYYQSHLEECPYCPKPGTSPAGPNQLKNTVISDLNQSGWDHTKIDAPVEPPYPQPPAVVPATDNHSPLTKTQILPPEPGNDQHPDRKLVGWLVSYSIHPAGADFRLYEGRNVLGADPACDIVVPNDPAVSARHLTILYRIDGFRFKDELSTNGTFVNNEMRHEGMLQDGDLIRLGNTEFKFRSAL